MSVEPINIESSDGASCVVCNIPILKIGGSGTGVRFRLELSPNRCLLYGDSGGFSRLTFTYMQCPDRFVSSLTSVQLTMTALQGV